MKKREIEDRIKALELKATYREYQAEIDRVDELALNILGKEKLKELKNNGLSVTSETLDYYNQLTKKYYFLKNKLGGKE